MDVSSNTFFTLWCLPTVREPVFSNEPSMLCSPTEGTRERDSESEKEPPFGNEVEALPGVGEAEMPGT